MAILRHILFCLLASKMIHAACSSNRTFTIRDTTGISALAICSNYIGDIAVGINMSGIVSLPKLETLKGSLLLYNNLGLSALRADSLISIDGQLIIKNAQNLTALAFPKLSQVGDLVLDSSPKLAELGIDVQNATNIYIGENRLLGNTTLHVKAIGQKFTLFKNGNQLKELSLPELAFVEEDFLVACNSELADLEIPSLDHVGQTMNMQGNPAMTCLQLPELESVTGGLFTNLTLNAPKLSAIGAVRDGTNPGLLNCTMPTMYSLATLSLLTSHSLERADLDASLYSTNPDLSTDTNSSQPLSESSLQTKDTNANRDSGMSTTSKAIIAASIAAAITVAAAIAICRFKVKRKLGKRMTKEEDEEEVVVTEVHSVAKDGSKTISTSTAIRSLEITTATLQMAGSGLAELPRPLRSHKSRILRPVPIATPITLATEPSPLPISFVAARPGGNTQLNGDEDSAKGDEEEEENIDRKGKGRNRSRSRPGQDLIRADTAHGFPQPIEFTNPFGCIKSLKVPAPVPDDQHTIIPSPTTQLPEFSRKSAISQLARHELHPRSNSLDSRCMSVSSQPPRLQLNLACSIANSSQTSLMVENTNCAVAESSSLQRLKPAVVHVRTPSPRMSGGFGAHYGSDPRLNCVTAEGDKRNSSV